MKNLLAAAAVPAIAGAIPVEAADIGPLTGHWAKLGDHPSALVYYIDAHDGLDLVVTTQQGHSDKPAVTRFETVLAAGRG
jgi:hypothetical protein